MPTLQPAPPPARYRWVKPAAYVGLAAAGFGFAYAVTSLLNGSAATPPGMVLVPGGEFVMGTAGGSPHKNEQPAHAVRVRSFYMDATEVTNAQFRAFAEATGHVTTAEKPPDWDEMRKQLPPGTPKPPPEKLVPGSMVFAPPADRTANANGWRWTPGASWRHPEGPGSDLTGREQHPVVQVSWDDAAAYAAWAGKRLPTEAEWEYACRGGLAGKRFPWGDADDADARANVWQGDFPRTNTKADGWDRTAPVKSYPPNGYGLYDMGGNVWEWCGDWYRADAYAGRAGVTADPPGPAVPWDPTDPLAPKRVTRGGSFLCHATTCVSYRPAARRGTPLDTGMSHIGFRCAKSRPEGGN